MTCDRFRLENTSAIHFSASPRLCGHFIGSLLPWHDRSVEESRAAGQPNIPKTPFSGQIHGFPPKQAPFSVLAETSLRGRNRVLRGRRDLFPGSENAFSGVGETFLRGRRARPPGTEKPFSGVENTFSLHGETLLPARRDRSGRAGASGHHGAGPRLSQPQRTRSPGEPHKIPPTIRGGHAAAGTAAVRRLCPRTPSRTHDEKMRSGSAAGADAA